MNACGALPLAKSASRMSGLACHRPEPVIGHILLPEGRVRIALPRDGVVSDAQARRLAWALLADLAPDEVVSTPTIVTYKEAQRLAVLRAVAGGARTAREIAVVLEWTVKTAQRRASELVGDGRLAASRAGRGGEAIRYSLKLNHAGA